MSAIAAWGNAGLAVVKRDVLVFLTYRNRVIAEFLSMVFVVTIFYYVSRLVSVDRFPSPGDYFAFVAVGIVIFRSLLAAYGTFAMSVRQELVAGTFERMVTSPFGATAGTTAMILFPFFLALVVAGIAIGFAAAVFGLDIEWTTVPLAVPAGVLAVLAFIPFGVMIGATILVFKQTAGMGLFLAILALVSGIIFPVELLPGWIRWVSDVQPFTPAVELLRHLIVGIPLDESAGLVIVKILGFTAVFLPLSLWMLNRAIDFARRKATLIEY